MTMASNISIDAGGEDTAMLLSVREVMRMTGLGRTTLWKLQRSGQFPKSRRISARRVGHLKSEVERWIRNRQLANASSTEQPT